jgi:uncharacterized protein (TIGR02172 family)
MQDDRRVGITMKEISLDQPLARGRTADVFAWDEGTILKLFHNWFELENIEYEQRIAQAVHTSGVRAPAVIGEIVEVEGRRGLIYERVEGRSMLEVAPRQPWKVFALAKNFAALHARMHACVFAADVPRQRAKFEYRLSHSDILNEALKTKLLNSLKTLPDGDYVCHGDFHPGNILLSNNGGMVIDWIDAARGNPLADVARTSIILRGVYETGQMKNAFLKIFVRLFHAAYLREYFRLRPGGEDEYRHWLPIVAAARLSEGIKEIEAWLVEQSKK